MACIKSHPARCLTSWLNQTSYDTVWFEGCQRTCRLPTGKDRGVITIEGHGLVWTVVVIHQPVVRTTRRYPASLSLRMNHSHCGQILSGLMTGVTLLLIISDVKSEDARICVTTNGFTLGPAISCTSGYLINVTGAEYLDLNSTLCGTNKCPCDHVVCRVNVDTVDDGGSLYNSIISHCQYKPRCKPGRLYRTSTSPCRGADLLLINYTCLDKPSFPTPTTPSQITGNNERPAAPTTSGSSSQDNAGSDSTDQGTTSTGPNGLTATPSDNPESDTAIAAGASAGAVVIIIVIVVAVICIKRRQGKSPKEGNDYRNDRAGGGHPNALVMGPVATVEPYSETIVGRPDGPPGGPPAAEYSYAAVPDRLTDMPGGDGSGDDGQDKDPTYSVAGTLGDNREAVATPTGAQKAAVPDVYSQVKLREPRLSKREVVSDHLDVTENAIYGEPLT